MNYDYKLMRLIAICAMGFILILAANSAYNDYLRAKMALEGYTPKWGACGLYWSKP